MQSVFLPERLFSIIGSPLGHSLSPLLHNWGFQRLGLPYVYFPWEVTAEGLPEVQVGLRSLPLFGASVTIPHKQSVMPYLDELTATARRTGAVNTLYWSGGRLWGENTDAAGFLQALDHKGIEPSSVLVLGCGGAAHACVSGLLERGVRDVAVSGRNEASLQRLRQRFAVRALPWEDRERHAGDLLVNATPLGMKGATSGRSPVSDQALAGFRWVVDLVYNPLQTPLLSRAESMGARTADGLWMFVFQGLAQFELWTGGRPPALEARSLLEDALGRGPENGGRRG
jgi:shikimate dehydrogenase